MAVLLADVVETNHEVFFVILMPGSRGARAIMQEHMST